MKNAGKICGIVLITYFVTWTVVYSVFMQGDFSFFGRYLQLAWTAPGEIPAMIQLVALVFTVIAALSAWILLCKRPTKNATSGRERDTIRE